MSYNELKQHGTADFPFGFYQIDRTHPKYEMAFHWHQEAEVIRVLSGKLHITLNNRERTAEAGDIVFVNNIPAANSNAWPRLYLSAVGCYLN